MLNENKVSYFLEIFFFVLAILCIISGIILFILFDDFVIKVYIIFLGFIIILLLFKLSDIFARKIFSYTCPICGLTTHISQKQYRYGAKSDGYSIRWLACPCCESKH